MTWLSSKYHPAFYDGRAVLFITMDVMERVGKKEKKKRNTRSKYTRQTCACTTTARFGGLKEDCLALQVVFAISLSSRSQTQDQLPSANGTTVSILLN